MAKSSFGLLFMKACFVLRVLAKHRRMSLEQINELWVDNPHGDGIPISLKCFESYRNAIADIYGIDIRMERSGKGECTYIIDNPDDLDNNKVFDWTLSALSMSETLLKAKKLHNRILMDGFPSENGRLDGILEAMDKGVKLKITYKKYLSSTAREHTIEPYCTKQYGLRLYLIGRTDRGGLCPFALDRIFSMEILDEKFKLRKEFDAQTHFINAYGVMADEAKWPPQKVILRAFDDEPDYLRDVPIHSSQKELSSGGDFTDFEYYLGLTNDFIGKILERGDRIQVLAPQVLVDKVRRRIADASGRYTGKRLRDGIL